MKRRKSRPTEVRRPSEIPSQDSSNSLSQAADTIAVPTDPTASRLTTRCVVLAVEVRS
jgi:hypothetical protein